MRGPHLTPRQLQCVQLYYDGYSTYEISKKMTVSVSTVHDYMKTARRQFKVTTRDEVLDRAAELGFLRTGVDPTAVKQLPDPTPVVVQQKKDKPDTQAILIHGVRCPHCLGTFRVIDGTAYKTS